jgi:hypothetical protein
VFEMPVMQAEEVAERATDVGAVTQADGRVAGEIRQVGLRQVDDVGAKTEQRAAAVAVAARRHSR